MISRAVAIGLLAAGSLTAAAGGAYLASRPGAAPAPAVAQPGPAATEAPQPAVSETEAVIEPSANDADGEAPAAAPPPPRVVPSPAPAPSPRRSPPAVVRADRAERAPASGNAPAPPPERREITPAETHAAAPPAVPAQPSSPETPAPFPAPSYEPRPTYVEEIVVPASAVIGLEVETSLNSERARVEDRVDARVTRDVYADGRLAIPAGSRVIGTVTLVERGGKVKERARLGVRFHTLVLAGGRQLDLRTDTIYHEGPSPSGDSSRKIGGAAVGGAVLGAIMGGGKGALLGGAAGAAGGTAAVMAGDRQPATLPSGTIITARLASPVTVEVERR